MLTKKHHIVCGCLFVFRKFAISNLSIYLLFEQLLLVVPGLFVVLQAKVDKTRFFILVSHFFVSITLQQDIAIGSFKFMNFK